MRRKTQELVEVIVYAAVIIGIGVALSLLWAIRYAEEETALPVIDATSTYEANADISLWLGNDPSPPRNVLISTFDCPPPNRWVSHRARYGKSHTVQLDFCEVVEPDAGR